MASHHYTWNKLVQNAYRLNPKSRGPKYPYTPRFEYQLFSSGQNSGQKVIVPYKGTSTLLISLRAWGVTQSSLHNITLLFADVDIQTENPNNTDYFQVQYEGKMYWCKKLDKFRNPLTSRCSCFTGDTKVLLADGTIKTFKELEGQTFEVNSYNYETKEFEIAKAGNSSIKKENEDIIEITFSDNSKIKCTPDHKFHLVDNSNEKTTCEAKDLLGKIVKAPFKNLEVINIQPLGKEDVYCLTVPEYGNFCLANGVLVDNCADEFFTFALWKHNAGCLYGPRPKPYQRKTTTYPERNPAHIVGCCKHVYNAWTLLKNSGLTLN